MKVNLACKNILMSAILATGIMTSGAASAGLVNSSLSGFNGWTGDVTIDDGTLPPLPFDFGSDPAFFNDYSDSFDFSVPNGVTISLYEDPDNLSHIIDVYLSQTFNIDPIAAGSSLWLSFDVDLDADLSDLFFLQLEHTSNYLDLTPNSFTSGVTSVNANITAWAGLNDVELLFGISDMNFVLDDSLTISNIDINEEVNSVPEPSTLLLFVLGIIAINRKKITTL